MECWQRPTRSDCVHAGVTFVRRLPKQLLELSEEPRKLSGFSHTHFSSQARRHPERQDVQGERREARLPERAAPRRHTQGRHHRARVSIASAHGGALAGRSFDHLVHRTLLPLLTEVIDGRLGAERALEARKVAQRIDREIGRCGPIESNGEEICTVILPSLSNGACGRHSHSRGAARCHFRLGLATGASDAVGLGARVVH